MTREPAQRGRARGTRQARCRLLLAAATLAGFVGLAAAASAQLEPAGLAVDEQVREVEDTDRSTLRAPQNDDWQHVAGARYGETDAPESPTPFETDLFTVAFRSKGQGFVGGARCPVKGQSLESCDQDPVPVIYAYTEDAGAIGTWREVPIGEGRGFVGAIAWLGPGRALAVGGDGSYPRREPGDGSDDAGGARAWLYSGGSWRELTAAAGEIPERMSALTALAYSSLRGFAIAGGHSQLWRWREAAGFTPETLTNPALFHYRVRDVRFIDWPLQDSERRLIAVTAGCCRPAGDPYAPAKSIPRALVYNFTDWDPRGAVDVSGKWTAVKLGWNALGHPRDYGPGANLPNDTGNNAYETGKQKLRELKEAGAPVEDEPERLGPTQTVPDSYFSFVYRTDAAEASAKIYPVASPGGPRLAGAAEPGSGFTDFSEEKFMPSKLGSIGQNGDALTVEPGAGVETAKPEQYELVTRSMRLLDAVGNEGNGIDVDQSGPTWVVGVRLDPGQASLGRGVVLNNRPEGPRTHNSPPDPEEGASAEDFLNYRPTSSEQLAAARQPRLQLLPSYGLHSLTMVGSTGVGWAVGDRGAILKLSESVALAKEAQPPPPDLGTREPRALSERGPYEQFRPTTRGPSGPVPALSQRPLRSLASPEFVPVGQAGPSSNADVSAVVMSRDGKEGWAIGKLDPETLNLYHFEGQAWRPCELEGACAGLREELDGFKQFVELRTASRVPFENDEDPSNDDRFEVVAAGELKDSEGQKQPVILRYRDGHWRVEVKNTLGPIKQTALQHVAFVAPDDGWLVTGNTRNYRFTGGAWVQCPLGANDPCADPDDRLPEDSANHRVSGLRVAGTRVYLSTIRSALKVGEPIGDQQPRSIYPAIIHRDPGGKWTAEPGGDPGFGRHTTLGNNPGTYPNAVASERDGMAEQGQVFALSVSKGADGAYQGWAAGHFGGAVGDKVIGIPPFTPDVHDTRDPVFHEAVLLRLRDGRWSKWTTDDAARDYLLGSVQIGQAKNHLSLPGSDGEGLAFIAPTEGPMITFDDDRWRVLEAPFQPGGLAAAAGQVSALAPDGEGGFWAAVRQTEFGAPLGLFFYHHTDRAPEPVFEDAQQPLRGRITALAGAADGSVWAATTSDLLARYDRLTRWETVRIPGWDLPKATVRSEVNAVAVNPAGTGVAVGKAGRIANLGPEGVRLDPAAGTVCDVVGLKPPCGTSQNLRAAAVSPEGAAMAGGDRLSLVSRPPGGDFRAIAKPEAGIRSVITGISMPSADRAWLTTDTGLLFAGTGDSSGAWSWRQENLDDAQQVLGLPANGEPIPLNAIAVDARGKGFAVGDDGLILERDGSSWKVLESDRSEDLRSVALPAGGGEGALIGGPRGLVLTLTGDRFEPARLADVTDGHSGDITGVTLLPGTEAGEVEAWAAVDRGAMLHYSGDSEDPLLRPGGRARAVPDTPSPRAGEIALAAFGKSECEPGDKPRCPDLGGTTATHELIIRRVVAEVLERARRPGGPAFALFTGDAIDSAGAVQNIASGLAPAHRRWTELVADRLGEGGVPLLGAIGGQDLTSGSACAAERCVSSEDHARFGSNLLWRIGMAGRPAPWGRGKPLAGGRYRFRAVPDPVGSHRSKDVGIGDPDRDDVTGVQDPDGEGSIPRYKRIAPTGGARTHYAVDVIDDSGGASGPVARLVFVDTSLRSLAAADPIQQPLEAAGGQQGWLEKVLCVKGAEGSADDCTRQEDQQAIVVSNAPSYAYEPEAAREVQTDSTAFEALLMKNRANLVLSGRLGWNGRYWALAPGVHDPCPGGPYPSQAPDEPGVCGQGGQDVPVDSATAVVPAAGALGDALRQLAPPPPPAVDDAAGAPLDTPLPFVVASSAGGKLASSGLEATAKKGFWRGYTIVRLDASGDSRATIVEQRPIFDWVTITAISNTLRAGQRMTLHGFGREPLGINEGPRYYDIDSPTITHRYDLLEADPEKPWLPREDEDGEYVPLDPSVATIDSQSGLVSTGKGNRPRTFGIGLLSVGNHTATYPIAFEPRKSFTPKAPVIARIPAIPPRVAAAAAQPPPAPPVPQSLPKLGQLQLPEFPQLTFSPPPQAEPPPPPPAPPAPPVSPLAAPLQIAPRPVSVTVAPPSTVIPPPAPPIQPAPPGGARREARQRQAASAKSEQSVSEGATDGVEKLGGDLATGRVKSEGSQMSRRERVAPAPSFTAMANREQPSAWARGALYGGGLTLMALVLSSAWVSGRPGSRRSRPEAAPARAEIRSRPWER